MASSPCYSCAVRKLCRSDGHSGDEILQALSHLHSPAVGPSQSEVEHYLWESNFSRRETLLAIAYVYTNKRSAPIAQALQMPRDWVKNKLRWRSPLRRAIL